MNDKRKRMKSTSRMFKASVECGLVSLFIVALTGQAVAQTVSFNARRDFAAGNTPNSVAVGDFNGDGKPDLAVANISANDVSVLVGYGDGRFQVAANIGVVDFAGSVAVGELNGDGVVDLAVSDGSVLLGNGDGTFRAATNFAAGG